MFDARCRLSVEKEQYNMYLEVYLRSAGALQGGFRTDNEPPSWWGNEANRVWRACSGLRYTQTPLSTHFIYITIFAHIHPYFPPERTFEE